MPIVGGGAPSTFSALQALPAGLSIATGNGFITGTPSAVTGPNDYFVKAQNVSGFTIGSVNIQVLPQAPTGLTYATPVVYTVGQAITDNIPTSSGGPIASYQIMPSAPSGLTFDTLTGVLSGTPTAPMVSSLFVVTGQNASGASMANINITVNPPVANPWTEQAYLKAFNNDNDGVSPPGSEYVDMFGSAVAITGDLMVVGSIYEDSAQTSVTNGPTGPTDNASANSGAAYVYRRNGATWVQEAYLKASNADSGDWFGYSVAVGGPSGDTIIVGAIGEGSNGVSGATDNSISGAGAVYVFRKTGPTWAQEAYLKPTSPETNAQFGYSVTISANTVAVGSSNAGGDVGSVSIYTRSGAVWSPQATLTSSNAATTCEFGTSVALDTDTLVVGARNEDSGIGGVIGGGGPPSDASQYGSGAAYVYTRSGTVWTVQAYIKTPLPQSFDYFGQSVSISGNTLLVGAPGVAAEGAAYVFTRSGATWSAQDTWTSPVPDISEQFGGAVALDGNIAVVGAFGNGDASTAITQGVFGGTGVNSSAGAAYTYLRTGSVWAQTAYLKAPNSDAGDYYGASVALSATTTVVGAPRESSNQTTITNGTTASSDNSAAMSGAVYVIHQ
jgi:hypothetical protein